MPWLSMVAQDVEALDADMVERLGLIGSGGRCSGPRDSTGEGMMAVLVVPEHIERMPLVAEMALLDGERADAKPSGGVVLP
jgi:hypothetical protein